MYHGPPNVPEKKLGVKNDTIPKMQTKVLTGFQKAISFEAYFSIFVRISGCGLPGTFLIMFTQRAQVQRRDAIIIAPNPRSFPTQRTIFPHPKGHFVSLSIMRQGKKVKFIQKSKPGFTRQWGCIRPRNYHHKRPLLQSVP